MKFNLKSVSAAVAVALAAATAHAQLPGPPGYSTTQPDPIDDVGGGQPERQPVLLSLFDPTTHASEVVSLGYDYANITGNSFGNFTNPTPGTNGWTVSNGTATLDFGTVPQFASAFGASDANLTYWITGFAGSATGVGASLDVLITQPVGVAPNSNARNTVVTGVGTAASNFLPGWIPSPTDAGVTLDPAPGGNPNNAGDNTGWTSSINNLFNNDLTGTTVGSALNLWNLHNTGSALGLLAATELTGANGAGFFMLTAAGDLTWNVPVSAVPLPAAAWLLLSGLAGLGAVGRRRLSAEAV